MGKEKQTSALLVPPIHDKLARTAKCGTLGENLSTAHINIYFIIGFPKQHKKRQRTFQGYRTGDIVKAVTPKGTYQGRIAIRHRPSFRLGKVDIHTKYIRRVQRADGYQYEKGVVAFHPHVSEGQGYPRHGFMTDL